MKACLALAAGLIAASSLAEAAVPADRMAAATATVKQYATEMNELLPCAYFAFAGGTKPVAEVVESTYGAAAVREAVDKFARANGGGWVAAAQLMAVYADAARPNYVRDIRDLAQSCTASGLIRDLVMFSRSALPLFLRPPFNGK
jgi:hypothetical protein